HVRAGADDEARCGDCPVARIGVPGCGRAGDGMRHGDVPELLHQGPHGFRLALQAHLHGRPDIRRGRSALVDSSSVTTIGMHYDVIPGKEEEFEKGFLATLEVLKTLPGHVDSHLYEDVA